MKKSYIATDKEAALLHIGQQTEIIVPMKVQPEYKPEGGFEWYVRDNQQRWVQYTTKTLIDRLSPYALHQPVYVREKCYQHGEYKILSLGETGDYEQKFCTDYKYHFGNKPTVPHRVIGAGSMPKKAARTWFVPVEVQAIRVHDITEKMARSLNIRAMTKDGNTYKWGLCGNDGLPYGTGWKWDEFTNTLSEALAKYIAQKLGQKAWDDNVFIWIYKIQKHTV